MYKQITVGGNSLKFYEIPKVIVHQGRVTEELTKERRRLWLARINRANFAPDPSKRHYKVCSGHFISGMKSDLFDKTNPDWAPSLKLGYHQSDEALSLKKRHERTQARTKRKSQHQASQALLELQSANDTELQNDDSIKPLCESENFQKPVCKFHLMGSISVCKDHGDETEEQKEIMRLRMENNNLREKLNAGTGDICPDTFKDEEKVKHYTGLTYQILMTLFTFLEPHISHTSRSSLSFRSLF